MISPEAVAWAKPRISKILGVMVEDAEVESVLAMENDEVICRHLAAFSESPGAYIHATDFIKEFRKTFVDGTAVKAAPVGRTKSLPKKAVVTFKTLPQPRASYKNEADTDHLIQDSLLAGTTVSAPASGATQKILGNKVCGCMALDHELSRNCIMCGRIICALEADPACPVCGFGANLKEDKKTFRDYKAATGYSEAVALTQKLITFDQEAATRTRVYDTDTDFYEEQYNPWSTETERNLSAAYAQREEVVNKDPTAHLIANAKLNIDLENMELTMTDAQRDFVTQQNAALQAYLATERDRANELEKAHETSAARGRRPSEEEWIIGLESCSGSGLRPEANWNLDPSKSKVDDDSCLLTAADAHGAVVGAAAVPPSKSVEPSSRADDDDDDDDEGPSADPDVAFSTSDVKDDRGVCLTLHQPWASLIVYGLKRIEGRVWSTDYRGRLWIHAAALEPEPERIQQLEAYYRSVYPDPKSRPDFPPAYPTRCLLGCVDLVDVVTEHKGLWDKYPWIVEMSDSPYKFILKCPQRLLTAIPMPGEHKLWQVHKSHVYHRALVTRRFVSKTACKGALTPPRTPSPAAPSGAQDTSSMFRKVVPSYIDNNDPLTFRTDLVYNGHRATQSLPLVVESVKKELKNLLLVENKLEEIQIRTQIQKGISTSKSLVSYNRILDEENLKTFFIALYQCVSRIGEEEDTAKAEDEEQVAISDYVKAVWLSQIGDAGDRNRTPDRDAAESTSPDRCASDAPQRGVTRYIGSRVPALVNEVFLFLVELVASAKEGTRGRAGEVLKLYSIGGPHTPLPDTAELVLTSDGLTVDRRGDPLLIIGISGINLIALEQDIVVHLSPGDAVLIFGSKALPASKLQTFQIRHVIMDNIDLIAVPAIAVLRCNLQLC